MTTSSLRSMIFKVTHLLMITAQTDKYEGYMIDIEKQNQEATDPSFLLPFQTKPPVLNHLPFSFETLPPCCVFPPELAALPKAGLAALLLRSPQGQTWHRYEALKISQVLRALKVLKWEEKVKLRTSNWSDNYVVLLKYLSNSVILQY